MCYRVRFVNYACVLQTAERVIKCTAPNVGRPTGSRCSHWIRDIAGLSGRRDTRELCCSLDGLAFDFGHAGITVVPVLGGTRISAEAKPNSTEP